MASSLLILGVIVSIMGLALLRSSSTISGFGVNGVFGQVEVSNQLAPDFTIELMDGQQLTLSDLRGEVVLLDFWSSWCAPCRKEAVSLNLLYSEYSSRGVHFVGVSIWDRVVDVEKHLDEFGVQYRNGIDTDGNILVDYGVRGIPEKFIIGQDGHIVSKFIGPSDLSQLRQALDHLLQNTY